MNRRNFMGWLASTFGIGTVALESVPAEPKPLVFVLTFPESYDHISEADVARIRAEWDKIHDKVPAGKLVVLPPGAKLEVMTEPPKESDWSKLESFRLRDMGKHIDEVESMDKARWKAMKSCIQPGHKLF